VEWESEAGRGLFMVPMTNKEGFDYSETSALFLMPFLLPFNLPLVFSAKRTESHLYRLCQAF